MFAYCGNNPGNGSDPTGQWIIADGLNWLWDHAVKPAAKWVSKEVLKPAGKAVKSATKTVVDATIKPLVKGLRDFFSDIDGTLSVGFYAGGTLPNVSGSFQVGIACDLKGNVVFQSTSAAGFSNGTPCGSLGIYGSVTNAPTVNDLAGPSYQIGGSFTAISPTGLGAMLGGECNVLDVMGTAYYGGTGSLGITAGIPFSAGIEGHIETGYTTNYFSFNIFDVLAGCYHLFLD